MLERLNFFWAVEEGRYARRESRNVLAMYRMVRAQHPELTGIALYEKVVSSLPGVSAEAAQTLVRAAEQTFAEWPEERELTFRDVVHYLCFERFSRDHDNRNWTRTSLRGAVESVIPEDL